jgi:hypothetical protein
MVGGSSRGWDARNHPYLLLTVGCTALAVAVPGAVRAGNPPAESGASAVEQYVEQVPTASGPSAPGVRKPTTSPLSQKARRVLTHASPGTAVALEKIATSSAYGAPGSDGQSAGVGAGDASGSLGGGVDANLDASDGRLSGLLVVLILMTVGAVALAVRRGPP